MDGAGSLTNFSLWSSRSNRSRSQQPVHGTLSLKGKGLSGICLGSSVCLLWHAGEGCSKASLKPILYWLAASLGSYQVLLIPKSGLNVIYWGSNLCIYLLVRLNAIGSSVFLWPSVLSDWECGESLDKRTAVGEISAAVWECLCCRWVPHLPVHLWKSQISGNPYEKRVQMVFWLILLKDYLVQIELCLF